MGAGESTLEGIMERDGRWRVDYITCKLDLTPEEMIVRERVWMNTMDLAKSDGERGHTADVRSTSRGTRPGTYTYLFEAWGNGAEHATMLDPDFWIPYV